MTDPVFTVGGFWRFAESGTPGGLVDIETFFSRGIELATATLRKAGFTEADLRSGQKPMRSRVERGSLEDIAIALLASGHLGQMYLWQCTEEAGPSSEAIHALALQAAEFGVKYAIVLTMSGGLTEAAATGKAVLAGNVNSVDARRAQAERDQLERWGLKALEIARGYCAGKDVVKKADIIRAIRAHPDAGKPRLTLPLNDNAVRTFLTANGF